MKNIFITLQNASGLNNLKCGLYLGISEGAVRDRRRGAFEPKKTELMALAIYGSKAEKKAKELIERLKIENQNSNTK